MKRNHKRWTEEEEHQLAMAICTYQDAGKKIQWDDIAAQMCGRTRQQCKSFYQNVLKGRLHIKKRINMKWGMDMKGTLFATAYIYNKSWDFIQRYYFPQCTARQLQKQYVSGKKEFLYVADSIRQISADRSIVYQLSKQKAKGLLEKVLVVRYRLCIQNHLDAERPKLAQGFLGEGVCDYLEVYINSYFQKEDVDRTATALQSYLNGL